MQFNSAAARHTKVVSFGDNNLDTVFHCAVIFAAIALSVAAAVQNWAGADAAPVSQFAAGRSFSRASCAPMQHNLRFVVAIFPKLIA